MIQDLRKLWALLTAKEKRKTIWLLGMVILMALAETGGVISIVPFLSALTRPDIIEHNPTLAAVWDFFQFENRRQFITTLGLISMALVVGSAAFKTITLHLLNRHVHFLRHGLSTRLLSRYLNQPYEFFLERNPAFLSSNVLAEIDQLASQLILPVSQLIAQGAVVLAMAALIFWYNPLTALGILAVLAALYGVVYGVARKRLERIGTERVAANGQRYKTCAEALGGIKEIKISHAADTYRGRYTQASRTVSRHQATSETLAQAPLYLVEATGYSLLIVIALLLMSQSSDLARVLPALGLYGFAAYRMLPAAQIIYRGVARLKFSSASLDTIYRDLQLSIPPPSAVNTGHSKLSVKKEIRLEHISYTYPSAPEKLVLTDFSLTIPANTTLGIQGPSGAGKSTLMDILLGLISPQHGQLLVDGVTITDTNRSAWQKSLGYVPQHIYLTDASVAENIAFGQAPENIDMTAVERAARAAQIHEFIANELQNGYHTLVGDRGIRLSGGQRQRVGIARALYHDPPVLLMDEATSALDTQTEEALNDAIAQLAGHKTVILIAHRTASLARCERVVQLDVQ